MSCQYSYSQIALIQISIFVWVLMVIQTNLDTSYALMNHVERVLTWTRHEGHSQEVDFLNVRRARVLNFLSQKRVLNFQNLFELQKEWKFHIHRGALPLSPPLLDTHVTSISSHPPHAHRRLAHAPR
jgi:hypothetical protein